MASNCLEICRIHLQSLGNVNLQTCIANIEKIEQDLNITSIHNKLSLCFPELDLRINQKTDLCKNCLDIINIIHKVITRNCKIEEEIKHLDNAFYEQLADFDFKETKIEEDVVNHLNVIEISIEGERCINIKKDNNCSNLCRMCLKSMVDISEIFYADLHSLYNKLFLCFPEIILHTSKIPVICQSCFNIIDIIYAFKKTCSEKEQVENYNHTKFLNTLQNFKWNVKQDIKSEEILIDDAQELNLLNLTITKQNQMNFEIVDNYTISLNQMVGSIESNPNCNYKKTFKCYECNYLCQSKSNFRKHVLIHSNDKPYKCQACDYCCRQKSDLTRHMRIHRNNKLFKCHDCDLCYQKKTLLQQHILRIHKPFKCQECDYYSEYISDVRQHMFVHFIDKYYPKSFKCQECDCCFQNNELLQQHALALKHKSFKCQECDCRFQAIEPLQQHVLNHKPFKCQECDRRFQKKVLLQQHVLIHKPFKCQECDCRFLKKDLLQQHILIHKSFNCEECDCQFDNEKLLQQHLPIHKPFKCQECDYCCKYMSDLRQHMFIHFIDTYYP